MIKSFAIPLMAMAVACGPSFATAQPAAPPADFQARFLARMMEADANHDGRISTDEWQRWSAGRPQRAGRHADPAARFQRMDADHDGYLSADEIRAAAARAYERRQASGLGAAAH